MKKFILLSILLFLISCKIPMRKSLKDDIQIYNDQKLSRIEIYVFQDSAKSVCVRSDSTNMVFDMIMNSERALVKFFPTHRISIIFKDSSVLILSYNNGYIKLRGRTYKMTQKINLPTVQGQQSE